MRKVIVGISAFLTVTFCTTVLADGTTTLPADEVKVERYVESLYRQIDFGKNDHIQYEVFDKACRGYMNLRNAGKLNIDKEVISICDFSKPSTEKRLWVIDLGAKKVLFNTYVAHGQGSGDDGHLSFSNDANTHKSSLGFYVTGEIYTGEHGTSLRLNVMDDGYNDAAYDRGIVVHGADYVSDRFINNRDRLGRSWGCPAVPSNLSLPIIQSIKDKTCLFIYYPERHYLSTAYWLNKKIENVPADDIYAGALTASNTAPKSRIIQYMHNGKVDSTVTVPTVE